jgi:hypothetical protein
MCQALKILRAECVHQGEDEDRRRRDFRDAW